MRACLSHPVLWWGLVCGLVVLGGAVLFGAGYLLGLERQPQGRPR